MEVPTEKKTGQKQIVFRKTTKNISNEDMEIVAALDRIKRDLELVHKNFDYATDPVLVDSYVYEIMSLNMKYKYYLSLCKQKGLIAEGY